MVEALTGKKPRVYRKSDGTIIVCYEGRLDGFAELADATEKWIEL